MSIKIIRHWKRQKMPPIIRTKLKKIKTRNVRNFRITKFFKTPIKHTFKDVKENLNTMRELIGYKRNKS